MCQLPEKRENIEERFYPRFSQVAYMSQMPHVDLEKEVSEMKGAPLTKLDKEVLKERVEYAKYWLATYAPERYKFEIQKEMPLVELSEIQKEALRSLREFIAAHEAIDGQMMHTNLHEVKESTGIEPKEFFGAIYKIFLNKESGPKAGWFLSVLDRDFVLERLEEAGK
jgi:lysyl-tRNA synthetase class 1